VALCSTTLTAGHLSALQRAEARELILLLDGDAAGRAAVERLAPALIGAGASARVALLPEGEDPDTFARARGGEAVRALLDSALPLSEHLFRTLLPEGRSGTFERKMEALGRLRPVVAELPVGLLRSAFFSGLAAYSGLPAAELEAGLRGKTVPLRAAPKPAAVRPPAERPLERAEATLGALFLARPELLRSPSIAETWTRWRTWGCGHSWHRYSRGWIRPTPWPRPPPGSGPAWRPQRGYFRGIPNSSPRRTRRWRGG